MVQNFKILYKLFAASHSVISIIFYRCSQSRRVHGRVISRRHACESENN